MTAPILETSFEHTVEVSAALVRIPSPNPPGDVTAIATYLRDALANSKDKVVILAGDRQVILGEVVRVLGLAKEAGASGFALASE